MEGVKWLIRKWGLAIFALLLIVIAGIICWSNFGYTESNSVGEKVWEPPVEIAATLPAEEPSIEQFVPQTGDSLISDEEKEQLQREVLTAAESVSEIYKEAEIVDVPYYYSGVNNFTSEQCRAVVEELGNNGFVSVEDNTNMQNHEKMEQFYETYLNGQVMNLRCSCFGNRIS